jgi:hypothetical protein
MDTNQVDNICIELNEHEEEVRGCADCPSLNYPQEILNFK